MKTFIIYNSVYEKSKRIAKECLKSFEGFSSWEPELHDGCTPSTLKEYDEKYNVTTGPRTKKYSTDKLSMSKTCCFYSHYEVWLKCIDLDEPIAVVEHDTECIGELNIPDNFDMNRALGIQLTTDSMLSLLPHYRKNKMVNEINLTKNGKGIHDVFYVHPHGKKYFAGGTGYVLTPEACKIIVDWCEKNGWTQNDLLFDDQLIDLQYVHPSPIEYVRSKELNSSAGLTNL